MVPGATSAEAIDKANEILGYMGTDGAEIFINGIADGEGNMGSTELDDETETVTVLIRVPVAENSLLVPKFTGDISFEAAATMRTERYDGYYDPFNN